MMLGQRGAVDNGSEPAGCPEPNESQSNLHYSGDDFSTFGGAELKRNLALPCWYGKFNWDIGRFPNLRLQERLLAFVAPVRDVLVAARWVQLD